MRALLTIVVAWVLSIAVCLPVATADFESFFDDEGRENVYGAKIDAPNLVRLSNNFYAGVEWSKDGGQGSGDGHTGLVKLTWRGTLKDFSKSGE